MDKYRDTGIPRSQDTLRNTGIHRAPSEIQGYRDTQGIIRDTGIPRSQDTLRDTGIHRRPSEIQGYRGTQGIIRNIGKQGYTGHPKEYRGSGIPNTQGTLTPQGNRKQGYWDTRRNVQRHSERQRGTLTLTYNVIHVIKSVFRKLRGTLINIGTQGCRNTRLKVHRCQDTGIPEYRYTGNGMDTEIRYTVFEYVYI